MALPTRVVTVLAMVVSPSPESVRIRATAASATAMAPAGAVSVTSTDRSPETSPSLHTRVPGGDALARMEPEGADNARTASSFEAISPTDATSARGPPASSRFAPGSVACSGVAGCGVTAPGPVIPGPGLTAG
ncbi:hypothetical protein [Nonomuraea diastatica]|uniref:Uncharacterized protein n=1 Tax=Nonomuraea diastatica TaxID=1848329 RepID=A0A4R4WC00_9ACTN|nr:hypothetical protein [Nonomuraea diastatica]TDD16388.1 hypothetical protein E1294_31420 [Nonomuraea diastatica]